MKRRDFFFFLSIHYARNLKFQDCENLEYIIFIQKCFRSHTAEKILRDWTIDDEEDESGRERDESWLGTPPRDIDAIRLVIFSFFEFLKIYLILLKDSNSFEVFFL